MEERVAEICYFFFVTEMLELPFYKIVGLK
jgi:hypothetical protein